VLAARLKDVGARFAEVIHSDFGNTGM
jgi:hypothetical protein